MLTPSVFQSIHVDHCSECGKVYQKNLRNMCMDCSARLDNDYRLCYRYLLRNRKADVDELSRSTGVSAARITQMIKDGKLPMGDYPRLGYGCEWCGTTIRSGRLCTTCGSKIHKEIQSLLPGNKEQDAWAAQAPVAVNSGAFRIKERLHSR